MEALANVAVALGGSLLTPTNRSTAANRKSSGKTKKTGREALFDVHKRTCFRLIEGAVKKGALRGYDDETGFEEMVSTKIKSNKEGEVTILATTTALDKRDVELGKHEAVMEDRLKDLNKEKETYKKKWKAGCN